MYIYYTGSLAWVNTFYEEETSPQQAWKGFQNIPHHQLSPNFCDLSEHDNVPPCYRIFRREGMRYIYIHVCECIYYYNNVCVYAHVEGGTTEGNFTFEQSFRTSWNTHVHTHCSYPMIFFCLHNIYCISLNTSHGHYYFQTAPKTMDTIWGRVLYSMH